MKLKFSWQAPFGTPEPACESDTPDRDGVSLVCCLLTDTGGLPYLSTVPWIDEGLRRISAVKHGKAETLRWGREDWGALLRPGSATIYSLNDEDYASVIDLDSLESALRGWLGFIQQVPDPQATMTVEI